MIKFALLGVICASNGVAVFRSDTDTQTIRVGQKIEGFHLAAIEERRVMLTNAQGANFYLYTGDIYLDEPLPTIKKGIQNDGATIRVTGDLKRYIEKDGLLTILMQAASEVAHDINGEVVGFRMTEIDVGSVYELAGIQSGDIVTEIDGSPLSSPFVAIRSLMRVRDLPEFSFTLLRDGLHIKKTIVVH